MQKLYVWWCFCFILAAHIVMTDAQLPIWTKPTCLTFTIDESDKDAGCDLVTVLVAASGDGTTVAYSVENVDPSGGGFGIGDDAISGNKKLTCTGSLLTASSYTVTVNASQPYGDGTSASQDLVISVRSGTGPICTQGTLLSLDTNNITACNSVVSFTCTPSDCSVVIYTIQSQTPSGGGFSVSGSTLSKNCSSVTDTTFTVVINARNTGDSATTSILFTITASGNSDNNILQRLKDNIKTSMSSVVKNWTSDRAADDNIGPDPDICQCCSGTENALLSWWMVDFEANIPINRIIVFSRSNEKDFRQLEGFQLSLSDNMIYNVTSFTSTSTQMFSIVYELRLPDILTQYIKIQRPGSLTLCEIKVFQGVCELGSFGHECEQRCHCADNRPCDVDTGYCQLPACKTGWQGQACNKKCPQDTFGEECSGKCYCAAGTCSNNYGACSGKCRSGYRGPHCNEECLNDTFGEECSRKCFCAEKTCTHDNGTCPGQCRIGYRGLHCNEAEESEMENKSLIIGVAVAVPIALVAAAVIIGVVVYRARHKNRPSGTNDYTKPNVNVTPTEAQEYDTLDDVHDVRGSESHGYENERVTGL